MTKEQQNQIIKDTWVRNLQKEDDIPSDIGNVYRNWLQSKINEASAQLQQPAQPVQEQQQGGAEQQNMQE